MTPTPSKPFTTTLMLKILTLIRARDLELLALRGKFQAGEISTEELTTALEASEEKIATEVFEACSITFSSLEATVDSVLQIQAQLSAIRALEAERIKGPVS